MKKFLSLLVVFTSLLILVACGGGGGRNVLPDKPDIPEALDTSRTIEVVFWHAMGQANQAIIAEIIEDFNKIYPNIVVSQYSQGGYNELRDKIAQAIPAGNQPTLAQTYPDHVALYLEGKAVRGLDEYMKHPTFGYDYSERDENRTGDFEYEANRVDDFVENFYHEGTVYDTKGTFYSLPFNKSTEVMFYNKTFFNKYDLEVPTTWEGIREVGLQLKALIQANPSAFEEDTRLFAYDSEANMFITLTKQWGGAYTSAAGEYLFDNAQSRAATQYFLNLYKDEIVATAKHYSANYASDIFKAEKVFMTTGSSAGATYNDPAGAFEVGVLPIPQKADGVKQVIQQGTNVTLFKHADNQVELAGWLFMKYLTGPEATLKWAMGTSYFPVRYSAYNSETYQAKLFGELIKKENGEVLLDEEGNEIRGEYLKDTSGNIVYDENGVPSYKEFVPTIQSLSTKVGYEQSAYFYTDYAFPGSSKCRDEVGLLIEAILYGGKTLDQAYADAMAELR